MNEDWRFKESPHVAEGGLRAYAGVPLRFDTEFGEHVAFGSLCVASNTPQEDLSVAQQRSLAQLADWVVADIIHSARARRHRERRHMLELTARMQTLCDQGANMEETIIKMLQEVYPSATIGVYRTTTGYIHLEGGTDLETSDLVHGLWEDCDQFDHMIKEFNHQDLIASRIVRVIAAQCSSERTPTFLLVGSKNFGQVFDDVDSGFIQMCATTLCRYWQSRILKEALAAKDTFLRGITHQLRTPIHGIIGSVELLTEELKSRAIISHALGSPGITPMEDDGYDPYTYIRTIKTSARDLISTINSLIKLNQWTDIAQAERTYTCHNIRTIESTLLKEVSPALPDDVTARPTLVFWHRLPPNCDSLIIDMRLFLDSVQPLIINAVQNTLGGVVAVTLSVTDDFQSLIVDVEDNGRGIPSEWHERVFKAYEKMDAYTIEAGLGLTLASRSALLMDGTVALVSSEVGQGSHFRATFAEPTCASSIPKQLSNQERFTRLPSTFYHLPISSRISSPSGTLSLSQYFGQYLENNGFAFTETLEGSLIIVDYAADLTQLYEIVSQVPLGHVIICMVPDHAPLPTHFGTSTIQSQDRIVFIQGPFSPDIFDGALAEANTVLTEHALTILSSGSCLCCGMPVHNSELAHTIGKPALELEQRCLPEAASCTSLINTTMIETELTKSIHQLRIIAQPSSPRASSLAHSCTPMLLLVDDNAVNLRLLEMYCTRRKFPYRTARDGAEAVRLFSAQRATLDNPTLVAHPFNLVLMDLQMPVCDGIDATRQLRALEEQHGWDRSVICIVTGQDSPADRQDANRVGSDCYLVKPVGPKVLDRWVKQWFTGIEIG
jgi:signal transduction histidine kinase/ActR/RegA family two-component response regulator